MNPVLVTAVLMLLAASVETESSEIAGVVDVRFVLVNSSLPDFTSDNTINDEEIFEDEYNYEYSGSEYESKPTEILKLDKTVQHLVPEPLRPKMKDDGIIENDGLLGQSEVLAF